ncbi:hypothetical protein [Nocardia sp. NPDC004711]
MFFGNGQHGQHGEPVAQDWASALGTIHYEVVTGLRGRFVKRCGGGGERRVPHRGARRRVGRQWTGRRIGVG